MERRKPLQRAPLKRAAMTRPRKGFWTCQRSKTIDGVKLKCSRVNPNRKRLCEACGGKKPAKKTKKHMAVLTTMTYEDFIEVFGNERCGICNVPPKTKRLARDHDHKTGEPRGLLCFQCNSALREYMTLEWLLAAVAYIEKAERVNNGG